MLCLICYDRCTTCRKAESWLIARGIPFEKRPIKEQRPSAAELSVWQVKSGLPLRRFFNTSGQQYRELGLKDRLSQMSREDMLTLLSSDGMLVKRPLLISDDTVLVGFNAEQWSEALAAK